MKGYHFYSPQSSTVIKSKMAATTTLRTRTRFRPPRIRLHCRLRDTLNNTSARNTLNNFSKDFQRFILKTLKAKKIQLNVTILWKWYTTFCWIIKQSLTIGPLMNVIIDHFTEAETKKKGRSWMKLEEKSRSNLSKFMSNIAFFRATIVSRDQRF